VYLALYARRAWVIFDHPYNADYLRRLADGAQWWKRADYLICIRHGLPRHAHVGEQNERLLVHRLRDSLVTWHDPAGLGGGCGVAVPVAVFWP
jgi:hypothetical protein